MFKYSEIKVVEQHDLFPDEFYYHMEKLMNEMFKFYARMDLLITIEDVFKCNEDLLIDYREKGRDMGIELKVSIESAKKWEQTVRDWLSYYNFKPKDVYFMHGYNRRKDVIRQKYGPGYIDWDDHPERQTDDC